MKLKGITTTYIDRQEKTEEFCEILKMDDGEENELINLYPQMQYQLLEGFGGAITDSSGFMYQKLDAADKEQLAFNYFDKEQMNYQMVRIPIDSCDFSTGHYEADSDENDIAFSKFDFTRVEKTILPFLDAAEKAFGEKIEIMLTPWSPPAYMKTNKERNHGGKILPEYKKRWAEYICRYIEEYRARGYQVHRMSLQNEPKAVQSWDSCIYTAEEEKEFLRDYMYPALVEHHLTDMEVFIWDHNKERAFERACTIIDEQTDKMVAGVAFHWYSGDHFEALSMIRERFPEKKLILSEACIEYSKFSQDDYLKNAQKYAHDIIGNLNHGMNGFYDWNLLLDEVGGPNHVGNFCDAPFLYDEKKNILQKRNTASYIWHFSHFLKPGAVRIGCTNYSDKLEVFAAQNQNGEIVLVVLNRTEEILFANVRMKDEMARIRISPDSITTAVIEN